MEWAVDLWGFFGQVLNVGFVVTILALIGVGVISEQRIQNQMLLSVMRWTEKEGVEIIDADQIRYIGGRGAVRIQFHVRDKDGERFVCVLEATRFTLMRALGKIRLVVKNKV